VALWVLEVLVAVSALAAVSVLMVASG